MVDRFHGFRFELSGDKLDQDVLELIQTEADNYSCFGWAQLSAKGTVVGEMRCPKARGKVLEDKVTKISPKVHKADILVMQPPVHAFLVLSLTIPCCRFTRTRRSGCTSRPSSCWRQTETPASWTRPTNAQSGPPKRKLLLESGMLRMSCSRCSEDEVGWVDAEMLL